MTTKPATKNGKQDALALLKEDHKQVRKLLDELAETTNRATKKRQELLEEIGRELRAHGAIEEEIFYPALRKAAEDNEQRKLVAEAFEEHRAAVELVLPDLEKTGLDTIEFGGRAKVLKELVEHHADEEEKEMFPEARELFSKDELAELGEQMQARKEEFLAQA